MGKRSVKVMSHACATMRYKKVETEDKTQLATRASRVVPSIVVNANARELKTFSKKILEKLHFVCMEFGQKILCLSVVLKLTFYSLDISFVYLSLFTFVKNMSKFVFLLPFYVIFISKHKKLKN